MTTIADARASLAQAVQSTGLRCSPYLEEIKNAPCAQITRGEFDPRMVFSQAHYTVPFTVMVFAPRLNPAGSFKILDGCADLNTDKSLIDAIQDSDNWTDADIHNVQVTNISEEQIMESAGVQYITVTLDVEVVW